MREMRDGHILLIEDNVDDEALTLRALRQGGIQNPVFVSRNGDDALKRLMGDDSRNPLRNPRLPEFVLLDLQLPGVSGFDVLIGLRSHPSTASLPVIVLSTSDEPGDILKCYELGANSYVQKPVDFKAFVAAIAAMGVYWLLHNKPCPANHTSYKRPLTP